MSDLTDRINACLIKLADEHASMVNQLAHIAAASEITQARMRTLKAMLDQFVIETPKPIHREHVPGMLHPTATVQERGPCLCAGLDVEAWVPIVQTYLGVDSSGWGWVSGKLDGWDFASGLYRVRIHDRSMWVGRMRVTLGKNRSEEAPSASF